MVDALYERGVVDTGFNDVFFSRGGDSRDPSRAGILGGAIVGSLLTMVVTLALSFPIGGVLRPSIWRSSRPPRTN